jgi:hypothetical protein
MSLLPGLSIIIPRYDPESTSSSSSSSSSNSNFVGDYSEETVFSATAITTNNNKEGALKNNNSHAWQTALQAMLATAGTAAVGNYFLGDARPAQVVSMTSNNPFRGSPSTAASAAAASRRSIPTIWAAVAPTAVLFGTKVYLEDLEAQESNHVFTSAVAGLFSGLSNRIITVSSHGNTASVVRLPPLARHLGTHVIGATLYFGMYDWWMNNNNNNNSSNTTPTTTTTTTIGAEPPNLLRVAAAGAMAGSVQSAVLVWAASSASFFTTATTTATTATLTASLMSSSSSLSRFPPVFLPTLLRAAPTHALIWCGYESMRYHST